MSAVSGRCSSVAVLVCLLHAVGGLQVQPAAKVVSGAKGSKKHGPPQNVGSDPAHASEKQAPVAAAMEVQQKRSSVGNNFKKQPAMIEPDTTMLNKPSPNQFVEGAESVPGAAPDAPMPWDADTAKLNGVEEAITKTEHLITELHDEAKFQADVDSQEANVGRDVTPSLAKMMGDIRREIHQIGIPIWGQYLGGQYAHLVDEGNELKATIDTEKQKMLSEAEPPPPDADPPTPKVAHTEAMQPQALPHVADGKGHGGMPSPGAIAGICVGAVVVITGVWSYLTPGVR